MLDLSVVRWFCKMFVFRLSSYLCVFLSACEILHWKFMLDFTESLHVARHFLNQLHSGLFKLKQVSGYYHVTRHS